MQGRNRETGLGMGIKGMRMKRRKEEREELSWGKERPLFAKIIVCNELKNMTNTICSR